MKLPKRSRTHQLEDLSIDKFKATLPPEWVYRTPSHDYGIDGEVEIFNSDGYTTGHKFLVQLKATDQKDKSKARRLRIKIEKYNYYRQLEQPVLIVRYLADRDELYVRWSHSLNKSDDSFSDNSISISFTNKDIHNKNTCEKVYDQLLAYYKLKSKPLEKPLKIDINFTSNPAPLENPIALVSKLIESGVKANNIFSFKLSDKLKANPIYIEIAKDEYHINLAGASSFRAKLPNEIDSNNLEKVISNINISLAILLQSIGHNSESEAIFDAFLETSTTIKSDMAFFSFITAKAATNKINDALNYIIKIIKEGALNDPEIYNPIQYAMVLITGLTKHQDNSKIENAYHALIDQSLSIDPVLSSIFFYNLGNFLSAKNRNREAIKYYISAAKCNPEYKDRAYWNKEIAGLLFNIRKYRRASEKYKKALEIDSSPETRAYYADSLMFSGFFKEALKEFNSAQEQLEKGDPEWCLKSWCLEQIVNELHIEVQTPGGWSGSTFISSATEDTAIDYLKSTNALCPDCWYFIATKLADRDEYDGATVCFLLAAFSDSHHKESWLNAFRCSMGAKDPIVLHHIALVISQKLGIEAIGEFFLSLDRNNPELVTTSLEIMKLCKEYNEEKNDPMLEVRIGNNESQKILKLK